MDVLSKYGFILQESKFHAFRAAALCRCSHKMCCISFVSGASFKMFYQFKRNAWLWFYSNLCKLKRFRKLKKIPVFSLFECSCMNIVSLNFCVKCRVWQHPRYLCLLSQSNVKKNIVCKIIVQPNISILISYSV